MFVVPCDEKTENCGKHTDNYSPVIQREFAEPYDYPTIQVCEERCFIVIHFVYIHAVPPVRLLNEW